LLLLFIVEQGTVSCFAGALHFFAFLLAFAVDKGREWCYNTT